MNANIYSHFKFTTARNNPLFQLNDGTDISYHEIDKKVAQYCNFFRQLNLKQGDRIVQQTEKCIDALCVYLASLRFGTIYIPLNLAFKREELAYFIEDAKPALFVCDPSKAQAIETLAGELNMTFAIETLSANKYGTGSIQLKVKTFAPHFNTTIKSKDDIACILYTSGTTGKPKGAMLSHQNLRSNGLVLKDFWQFNEVDTLLHVLPIFHCHGLFFACHCVLLSGASMIFLPKFDIDLTIQYLPKSTVMMGVPTYYTRLLNDTRFTQNLAKNMRLFTSGSAPLLEKTSYEFEAKIGQRILERYGMTETGINTSNPFNGDRQPGSVGVPLPSVNLKIVDNDDIELPVDQPGHIQIKGNNVFNGYWKKPDQTNAVFTSEGYFRTGDIGIRSEQNYISIVGREKDMIITGGMNVYPKEIERIINKIAGVKESAVIGLPHEDFGEAVTAIVVLNESACVDSNAITITIKNALANYKVPKKILFVERLPRNTMGKVQKISLRNKYVALFTR